MDQLSAANGALTAVRTGASGLPTSSQFLTSMGSHPRAAPVAPDASRLGRTSPLYTIVRDERLAR